MALLSRADILRATKVPQETVALPELGGEVIVRGMTGHERDAYEASCLVGKGRKQHVNPIGLRAKLVAACCMTAEGQRMFSDDDVQALSEVRADIVDRLFSVAQRLSGMSDEDVDELGLGSAKRAPTSSSSSPSQSTST